ncbi:MAG: biopolymer transporter ExbD [Polyangiaceae bacterium]|jgi:biopolymer transport protein ExbD|nr:biopolymer transporter ExbD [Polyangiaceae bacterium]MBK8939991.1 biopolymer transporter ExbD [Polyangiaceae bacterium]
MAGVEVGGGGKKRSLSADVNMVPFIDLLLVTVAFLLITAVWTTNSRINANAEVPGEIGPNPPPPERSLHVSVEDETFTLTWRSGSVVESESSVARNAADPTYGALREAISKEYASRGVHTHPDDGELDRLVVHTPNDLPFSEVVRVLDAAAETKREVRDGGRVAMVPAFESTFAVR